MKQDKYDDTEGANTEVSTWPVEKYRFKDECFYDDVGKDRRHQQRRGGLLLRGSNMPRQRRRARSLPFYGEEWSATG